MPEQGRRHRAPVSWRKKKEGIGQMYSKVMQVERPDADDDGTRLQAGRRQASSSSASSAASSGFSPHP